MSFLEHTKDFSSLANVFLRDPKRYLPLIELVEALMNGDSQFSHAQRELIALHVSQLNNCHYCVGTHASVVKHLGTDAKVIDSVIAGSSSGADQRMRPVLDFAEKLTLAPDKVGQADVDAVLEAGWSDQAVEDVVGVVSLFNFFNRLVNGIGLKGSPRGFEMAGEMFAKQGYGSTVKMIRDKLA